MTNPYDILGLDDGADEAAIRRRYLELVREFPPDRAPERFAAIRAAYDELRDPVTRLETRIITGTSVDSLDAILNDVRARLRDAPIPMKIVLAWAERP